MKFNCKKQEKVLIENATILFTCLFLWSIFPLSKRKWTDFTQTFQFILVNVICIYRLLKIFRFYLFGHLDSQTVTSALSPGSQHFVVVVCNIQDYCMCKQCIKKN